jgi:diphthamide biosynthesis protein 4
MVCYISYHVLINVVAVQWLETCLRLPIYTSAPPSGNRCGLLFFKFKLHSYFLFTPTIADNLRYMSVANADPKRTHYSVLGLQRSKSSELSHEDLKSAYRRTLLIHHPDKAASTKPEHELKDSANGRAKSKYTVDEIVTAYEVLADPVKRAGYDRALSTAENGPWTSKNVQNEHHAGVENFDLEDLTYDPDAGQWSKECRCGQKRGYIVTEPDLETESQSGEILVDCRGCSLYIKVLFAMDGT